MRMAGKGFSADLGDSSKNSNERNVMRGIGMGVVFLFRGAGGFLFILSQTPRGVGGSNCLYFFG